MPRVINPILSGPTAFLSSYTHQFDTPRFENLYLISFQDRYCRSVV